MDTLVQDLRYALRSLRRTPGFTAIVVLVMALGIGANVNVFTILHALLLRPWPLPGIERIYQVRLTDPRHGADNLEMSWLNFADLRDRSQSFAAFGGYWEHSAVVTIDRDPERFHGASITSGVLPALGVQPMLGRNFTRDEEVAGRNWQQVLISERIWRTRYGGSTGVLGRTLRLNGRTREIVGVMAKDVRFPEVHDFWIPAGLDPAKETRDGGGLAVVARLKPGVTEAQARAELQTLWAGIRRDHPEMKEYGIRMVHIQENWARYVRPLMLVMQVAVLFLLLIACSNVANLLLARAAARRREISLRIALGASRGRVVRQLLTESVLLSLLGASLGVLLGSWGIGLWLAAIPTDLPWFMKFEVDGPVLAFTTAIAVAAGILFGLAPALHASEDHLVESLREGGAQAGHSRSGKRLRNSLIVAEVAFSIVLLIGSGLMVRTFLNYAGAGRSLRTEGIVSGRVLLPVATYPSQASRTRFFAELTRRLRSEPGVSAATGLNTLPLGSDDWSRRVLTPDSPGEKEGTIVSYWAALPGALRTLGVPLLKGRDFTFDDDSSSARVALVSRTAADRLFGDRDPVGQRLRWAGEPDSLGWVTVVGVVGDLQQSVQDNAPPVGGVWVPEMQVALQSQWILAESPGDAAQGAAALRRVVRSIDPDIAVSELRTMSEQLRFSLWVRRLFAGAIAVFGVMALVIAAIGLYGVMAYSVAQRTQEIGIRMAVGAEASSVMRLVMGQAMRLTLAGIGIGLVAAFGVTRFMSGVIPGVSPTDPPTYSAVTLLLVCSGLLAAWLPAWRATRVNPMTALRCD